MQPVCGQDLFDQLIEKVSEVEETLRQYQDYKAHLKLFEVTSSCESNIYHYQQSTKERRYGSISA